LFLHFKAKGGELLMRNKLVISAASAALMLAVAVPAFAGSNHREDNRLSNLSVNVALVDNTSSATARTGEVEQKNDVEGQGGTTVGDNLGASGDAYADSTAVTVANTRVGCSACDSRGVSLDLAFVDNSSRALATSGEVEQNNDVESEAPKSDDKHHEHRNSDSNGSMVTKGINTGYSGDAHSTSNAWTVVNTRISR
jgi:hypothetical protein